MIGKTVAKMERWQKHHADLIVAAPELLAALKNVVREARYKIPNDVLEKAESAIVKAEGRSA